MRKNQYLFIGQNGAKSEENEDKQKSQARQSKLYKKVEVFQKFPIFLLTFGAPSIGFGLNFPCQ